MVRYQAKGFRFQQHPLQVSEACANNKVIEINVIGPERQRRGIYIALVLPHLASSGGATYRHSYAAPPELARLG